MSSLSCDFGSVMVEPSKKSKAYNVFNSTSKIQDFFGVDDVEELKSDKTIQNVKEQNSASQRIKNIFSSSSKQKRLNYNKLRRSLNKSKFFGKLKDSKPINIDIVSNEKLFWRPSLETIYKDESILNALIKFMTKQYNQENILFLLALKELNETSMDQIDAKIITIYNLYINGQYQVNLSSDCYLDILSKQDRFKTFNLNQKRFMFKHCKEEIEALVLTSILSSFYSSSSFQSIARKSKFYKAYLANNVHPKYRPNSSPSSDSSSSYSPYSSLSSPPIKLDVSDSAESFFEFDA